MLAYRWVIIWGKSKSAIKETDGSLGVSGTGLKDKSNFYEWSARELL